MKFVDDISQSDLSYYDSARNDAVAALIDNFELRSIYEYGTVKAPGISDLDLMIVLDTDALSQRSFPSLSDILPEHVRSIAAGGTVMVLDAALFSTINTWDDIQPKLLWGERIKPKAGSHSRSELHLARTVDWIPERILRLVQMTQMESVKISRAIGLVYSLCHSLRNVIQQRHTGISDELPVFVERIDTVRNDWFKMSLRLREQELTECITTGASLATGLIPLLAHALSEEGLIDSSIEGEFKLGKTGTLSFRKDGSIILDPNSPTNTVILPTIFYDHFINYAHSDGIIGGRIRSAISPAAPPDRVAPDTAYTRLLHERIEWIERQAKLLTVLGFATGLYKFGWFFSPSTRGVV